MALLEIFSSSNDIVEKLKGYVTKLDYSKIFFDHLGPELRKIFDNRKDKIYIKNFLQAASYEYGFFGRQISLEKAFYLYKKYADLNDYFCMYKMHVIYLCENEKFNVAFNRVLEKIYLLKCFAYVPNYVYDWRLSLFEKIDVTMEIAEVLDLEDNNLEKHKLFFDLLYNEREKYNLTENEVNLMKGCFFCYFRHDDDNYDSKIMPFILLNSLIPKNELDYAYYNAKNKCIYFQDYMKLGNIITDSEIEDFYKEVKTKKLYEFYSDYGNYYLYKKNNSNQEIIEIFKIGANEGYSLCNTRSYQSIIDYYDFDEIINDYNLISILLNYLLENIVFENLCKMQFTLFMGLLIENSKFSDKIIPNYLIYIKEINDYVNSFLNKKEINKKNGKENPIEEESEEYLLILKGYIYYFGFEGIEKQNLQKAVEYLEKGINMTKELHTKKTNEFIKYNIFLLMNKLKLISNEELFNKKKKLIEFFSKNLNLKYQTTDCYIIGEDYFEGIIKHKDEYVGLMIYKYGQNILCKTIYDCQLKSKIKKF